FAGEDCCWKPTANEYRRECDRAGSIDRRRSHADYQQPVGSRVCDQGPFCAISLEQRARSCSRSCLERDHSARIDCHIITKTSQTVGGRCNRDHLIQRRAYPENAGTRILTDRRECYLTMIVDGGKLAEKAKFSCRIGDLCELECKVGAR